MTLKISVLGLWHLGSVTAACLAHKGFDVVAYDPSADVCSSFAKGKAPVFEPGLDDLIAEQLAQGRLHALNDLASTIASTDLIWVTFDTPVDEDDHADIAWMRETLASIFKFAKDGQAMIISSQVPVGFCAEMESVFRTMYPGRDIPMAYSPENLRLGKAIEIFENPDRIVIGIRRPEDRRFFEPVLSNLSKNVLWMKTESAEMTKHAINSFLATSVVFANELATLCETTGADAHEVEQGLKSEARIGPKAYLKPGSAFAGGTLARDVQFLTALGREARLPVHLLNAILESNAYHRAWVQRKLEDSIRRLSGSQVTILGLTYKAGTDTLRRSWAVELSRWLKAQGVNVKAFDWQLTSLPHELSSIIDLKPDLATALEQSDSVVIGTDHPQLKEISTQDLRHLGRPLIIDPNGGLRASVINDLRPLDYFSVGHSIHRV